MSESRSEKDGSHGDSDTNRPQRRQRRSNPTIVLGEQQPRSIPTIVLGLTDQTSASSTRVGNATVRWPGGNAPAQASAEYCSDSTDGNDNPAFSEPFAPLELAIDAAQSGNLPLARISLETAVQSEPDNPIGWLWVAWISDSPAAAISALKQAERLAPDNPLVELGLTWARAMSEFDITNWVATNEDSRSAESAGSSSPAHPTSTFEERLLGTTDEIGPLVESAECGPALTDNPEHSTGSDETFGDEVIDCVDCLCAEVDDFLDDDEPAQTVETIPLDDAAEGIAANSAMEIDAQLDGIAEGAFDELQPFSVPSLESEKAADEWIETSISRNIESVIQLSDYELDEGGQMDRPFAAESIVVMGPSVLESPEDDAAAFIAEADVVQNGPPGEFDASGETHLADDEVPTESTSAPEAPGGLDIAEEPADAIGLEAPGVDVEDLTLCVALDIEQHPAEELEDAEPECVADHPWADESGDPEPSPETASDEAETDAALSAVASPAETESPADGVTAEASMATKDWFSDLEAAIYEQLADDQADVDDESSQKIRDEDHSADSDSSSSQSTILAVDDSPTIRKLVSMTLQKAGYNVVTATDGVEALDILKEMQPALILMDINMPKLNGYQLCKLVKHHENTREIPVIMLSGKDGIFNKLRGKRSGCDDYISKPFETSELLEKVAEHIRCTPTQP